MTKWKLVPVELWRELEPYLGKDVPDREVVLLSDVKGVLATPQSPKLSDERIFGLLKQVDPHAVRLPLGFKQFARAIEREILGIEQEQSE